MIDTMTTTADLTALEALYRANVRRVHGFAHNRVGEPDAADIVSEVFHAAALAVREGRIGDLTPAWLMAVARNKVMDHRRRAYTRKAKQHLTHMRGEDAVDFPADWTADTRRGEVIAALDALSAKNRSLLVLHHVDGMRIADLVELTGMSESAVESALARARRDFKKHYRGDAADADR